MTPRFGTHASRVILLVCALAGSITPAAVAAQTFEPLSEFEQPGRYPGKLLEDTDGSFYGTFSTDGPRQGGGLFRWTPGGAFTVLHVFDNTTPSGRTGGFDPTGRVVKGLDGAFYGTTRQGGANGGGTLFRWNGTTLTTVLSFPVGTGPREIIAGVDGYLYGTLSSGCGVLFRVDPASHHLETLHTFPCSTTVRQTLSESLFTDAQGTVYGVTASHTGATAGELGTIFRWDPGGLTTLHTFTGGAGAALSVIKGVDGAMYGATWPGGACRCGTLFTRSSTALGGTVSTLLLLPQNTYVTGLTQDVDGALYATMSQIGSSGSGAVFKVQGGTFSYLRTFAGDGEGPPNGVLLTSDGGLAGTTGRWGALPHGILFRMAKDGGQFTATALDNGQPRLPSGNVVHMPDGTIYGSTQEGGLYGHGTLYKRDASGHVTTVHSFAGLDGSRPSGLIRAADGKMYGTTQFGGSGGTLFSWDGVRVQTLYSFSSFTDGRAPQSPVIQGSDGSFYGTTSGGGLFGKGTLYRWRDNAFTVLHHFDGLTGNRPKTPLVEGVDGGIYGVTAAGGQHEQFSDIVGGTLFKWRDGALTVLRSFGAVPTDPNRPSGLLRAADGSLFGTTYWGGEHYGGTLFKLTGTEFSVVHGFQLGNGLPHSIAEALDGSIVGVGQAGVDDAGQQFVNFGSVFRWNGSSLSILQTFDLTQANGAFPQTITLGADGHFYGSTHQGGAGGGGTLFRVTLNAPPVITSITGPAAPMPVDTPALFTVTYSDRERSGHTCTFAWSDGQASTSVAGTGGVCSATHAFTEAGVYTVTVSVSDPGGLSDTEPSSFVVIYDPEAGFVTGNGWIQSPAGAYAADPTLEGRANFAFVSRYQRGATVPTGHTEFHFQAASFRFTSTSYDWLVVAGARAQFKGRGTINGAGDYGFLLTATDGDVPGGGGTDQFRVKISDLTNGTVLYDNVVGGSDTLSGANPQTIRGGSILIHAK